MIFEEDVESKKCICVTDKRKEPFIISKVPYNYTLFSISVPSSVVPKELSGSYSSIATAKQALLTWELNAKESVAAKKAALKEYRRQSRDATIGN